MWGVCDVRNEDSASIYDGILQFFVMGMKKTLDKTVFNFKLITHNMITNIFQPKENW